MELLPENQGVWLLWEQLSLRDRPNIMGVAQIPVSTLTRVCEALDLTRFDFHKLNEIEEIMFPFIRKTAKKELERKESKEKFKFKRRKGR